MEPSVSDDGLGIGEMIRGRRAAMGLSLAEVARRGGCAKSYLSAIENGVKGPPGEELAGRLEVVLRCMEGELVERVRWERTPLAVREDLEAMRLRDVAGREIAAMLRGGMGDLDEVHRSGKLAELIEVYEGGVKSGAKKAEKVGLVEDVDEDGQAVVRDSKSGGVERVGLPVEIPLINKVTAGYPGSFTDLGYPARVADEYVRAPDVHDPDAFAARVVGDSMEPAYREGDIVVFSPSKVVESGMDCFVRLEPDHETTFKRVYFEEGEGGAEMIRIQPINNAYGPMVVEREAVAGLYAGVSVTRSIG